MRGEIITQHGYIMAVKRGISGVGEISERYRDSAINNLSSWLLAEDMFAEYLPQIRFWIEREQWDLLLDKFYQVIPFGTGGRRGLVGIGLNRINPFTINHSAQGHAQYLIKKSSMQSTPSIVIAYGVRQYLGGDHYSAGLPNPVEGITAKELARAAAQVYAANGIRVYLFKDHKTTPELSYSIRHLNATGGVMIDSSHNPPEWCGKKVFDSVGGQLIPPLDQELTDEVTHRVNDIRSIPFERARESGTIQIIGSDVSDSYHTKVVDLSLSRNREVKIVYTPLHGPGITSVDPILRKAGFSVYNCPKTSHPSGKFENVKFNIPNPEVEESFEESLEYAQAINADLILNSDPDADRIGVMINHHGHWRYLNGNEIGIILTKFVLDNNQQENPIIVKTDVTSSLIERIARSYQAECVGDLLVGFKYIADVMNKLSDQGRIGDFLFAAEESHGYIAGDYARDKDAAVAGLWLAELSAELKRTGMTLVDYLDEIYAGFGYYRNYLTEIRMLGAEGQEKIARIQETLRKQRPNRFGKYQVAKIIDRWEGGDFLSLTDKISRNVLVFYFKSEQERELRITVRPSGTEPKIKFYFEISNQPCKLKELGEVKQRTERMLREVEKLFLDYCYQILKIDFPDRGYLLFWQLPVKDKLEYFTIEDKIYNLEKVKNHRKRKEELKKLVGFLGADPIEKVDRAFKARYRVSIKDHLGIDEF